MGELLPLSDLQFDSSVPNFIPIFSVEDVANWVLKPSSDPLPS